MARGHTLPLGRAEDAPVEATPAASESGDAEIAEKLMIHFVEVEDKECFSALLFTCYDMIRPDVALELSWRHNYTDFVMPYMIQFIRQLTTKFAAIDERTKPQAQEEVPMEEQDGYKPRAQV